MGEGNAENITNKTGKELVRDENGRVVAGVLNPNGRPEKGNSLTDIMRVQCKKCGEIKSPSEFYIRNESGKCRGVCKLCFHLDSKKYREQNILFIRRMKSDWQKRNPEKRARSSRRYYVKNKEKILAYTCKYKREMQSLESKLRANYRARIWKAVKRGDRSDVTMSLLGCSIDFLKNYIAKRFVLGMNWDNYGEWHIDHIIPCDSFDLSDKSQQHRCFNYRNLQPLWAKDNRAKNNKLAEIEGMADGE